MERQRGGTGMPLDRLLLPRQLFDVMIGELLRASPNEGCGIIATSGERAVHLYPGTNVEASAVRYLMDPVEVVTALLDIESRGWRMGATYHSHPAGPPWPSATDLREAYYPEALTVIVSLARAEPRAGAFALGAGTPRAVPFVID